MKNLLKNASFEGEWWRKTYTDQEFGEIFVPKYWVAFWKEGGPIPHDPNNRIGYGRPEMHVIKREPPFLDPLRVRDGNQSLKYFTFYRIHDAGVFQRVEEGIKAGHKVRATAWAHAWSSSKDDPHVSDGPGRGAFFALAGTQDNDGIRNFVFEIGIDPQGGTDPWSDGIVWGKGAHIYNEFAEVPAAETVAQGSAVTVFLRSKVLWPFKHCDTYWDSAELTVVGAKETAPVPKPPGPTAGPAPTPETPSVEPAPKPAESTGFVPPRQEYVRNYLLLPPNVDRTWIQAVLDSGAWERYRWTIGVSADDAGMGPSDRRVLAVNPHLWPTDLREFLETYYPGAKYRFVKASTPKELRRILQKLAQSSSLW